MRSCRCSSWSRAACPQLRNVGLEIRVVAQLGPLLLVFVRDVEAAIFIRKVGHRERAASSRLGARAAILSRVVVLVGKGTVGVDAQRAVRRSSVVHRRLYPGRRSKWNWSSRSGCSGGSLGVGAWHGLLRSHVIH